MVRGLWMLGSRGRAIGVGHEGGMEKKEPDGGDG